MKVSENFDVREFVPKSIYDKFGANSVWFVTKKQIEVAEFYKEFWTAYFKRKYPNEIQNVFIEINTYLYRQGGTNYRGYRPCDYKEGATYSQHRLSNAFDCEIIIAFKSGKKIESDYNEVHKVIKENNALFLSKGITTVESVKIAKGWLHTDFRNIPNQTQILIVGA